MPSPSFAMAVLRFCFALACGLLRWCFPYPGVSGPEIPGYSRLSPVISENCVFLHGNPRKQPLSCLICVVALFCCGKMSGKLPGKRKAAGVSSRQPPRRCCSNTGWPPASTPPQAPKACHSQSHTMLCGHIRNGYTSISAPRPAFPALKAPVPP